MKRTGPSRKTSRGSCKPARYSKSLSRSNAGENWYWISGRHPVEAALKNQNRCFGKIMATRNAAKDLADLAADRGLQIELSQQDDLTRITGPDILHQGVILEVAPLEPPDLKNLPDPGPAHPIVVLDQITDPRNVGAILRSAAIFGARAVVAQARHAPQESATLAKAASGALESIPLIYETNLARSLKMLQDLGYWVVGLSGEATDTLTDIPSARPVVLVLGAEGDGLRRLTTEACDQLARIAMAPNTVGSLNVSNAAAVALYALSSSHG